MNCNCSNYSDLAHEYEKCVGKTNQLEKYAAPMMWIGIYVALASLLCFLATAVDLFWCVHQRKFWFPCKYFTLNATYVTVIAVLTKILLDLNNPMPSDTDQLVKLSSTICLSTIMCNVMPSLGTMDEHEILMNLTALGILVITIVVNIFIQLDTGVIYRFLRVEFSLVAYLMFLLFVVMCFSALAVPSSKQYVEGKYGEIHEMASKNEKLEGSTRSFTTEKLAVYVTRYWIMAETGNPQFVMARFATCSTVGLICFLTALILVKAELQLLLRVGTSWFKQKGESDYKSTTLVILVLQSLGVLAGTIAPLFRWFISVSLKWSVDGGKFHRSSDFSIEKYWIQWLMELKQNPMALRIKGRKRRRIIHVTKTLALNLCIRVQIVIVLFSKMVRLVSIFIASPVLSSCYCCARSKKSCSLSEHNTEVDISRYVVRLEGERKLPKRILKNISDVVNRVIWKAKKHQPVNLMQLIERSNGFNGVVNFDSDQVEHLHSQEPPNCWSLVVVTLTSIAITLPNIAQDATNRLLSSVKEGLSYIRLIEKSLDTKGDLVNAKKAADYVWLGVELYSLWLDNDLRKIKETRTYKATLQILVDIARATVLEFKRNAHGGSDEDPLNWPLSIVASNSMYRISQTILTSWHQPEQTNSGIMFHQLSVVIADILGACLTNLPRVITMYCYCSTIENREENVRLAANLLGETEEILKVIQRHETPVVSPDQVVYIDEWRACLKEQSSQLFSCSSESNETFYPCNSGEFHISIESE